MAIHGGIATEHLAQRLVGLS